MKEFLNSTFVNRRSIFDICQPAFIFRRTCSLTFGSAAGLTFVHLLAVKALIRVISGSTRCHLDWFKGFNLSSPLDKIANKWSSTWTKRSTICLGQGVFIPSEADFQVRPPSKDSSMRPSRATPSAGPAMMCCASLGSTHIARI